MVKIESMQRMFFMSMDVENVFLTLATVLEGENCSARTAVLTVPQNTGCLNQVQGFRREDLLRA